MSTFTLYRFFDAEDTLLYVGLTVNPGRRMEKHRNEKPWWPEVARITMEQYPDARALAAAERTAIETEKPCHNIRMNGARPAEPEPERITNPVAIARERTEGTLVERWFHSYVPVPERQDTTHSNLNSDGYMRAWQGQIIAALGQGTYLAQLYSWSDGFPTNEVLVEIEDMKPWKFYASHQDMRCANGCEEDFDNGRRCGNPCTHVIRNWAGMGPIYRCWRCIEFYVGKVEEL